MANISLINVGLDIPIFNPGTRSLKKKILQGITGGSLNQGDQGPVVVQVLQNVNLELKHGDRVGLLGHNGAGKSTLLRVLSGIYKPTNGQVTINGEVASLIDVSLGIDTEATGRENIFMRAALLGLSKKQINEQLEEVIEFSELGSFIDMPVRTYSTGMHLRLAFSVSTVIRPEILIMDEWLSVGDESFNSKAENRIQKLIDCTSILVIASHSKELLLKTCNRIIWLEHGCIKLQGSPADICQKYFTKKMEKLNPAFDKDYGLTLNNLAERHEQASGKRHLTEIKAKFQQPQAYSDLRASQLQADLDLRLAELQAVYSSRSWRITSPLRWLGKKVNTMTMIWNRRQENKKFLKTILRKKKLPYRQLLVDISDLIQHDHGTGIQRVTRSILKNWLSNPPLGFKIQPVYATAYKSYRYATVLKNFFLDGAIKFHPNDKLINVNSGDIFLGLDLNHHVPIAYQTVLKYLHKNGVDVRFIVYDLLPIQFPDFFEKKHSIHSLKTKWLSFVTSLSGAICISKTVAEDLAVWMKNNPTASKRNFNINWFHLGADIDQSLPTKGFLQNEQLNLDNLRSTTTFLMVGTVEPRKGHAQVLDAFEKLWQDGADIKLIIVGKKGWLVNSLVTRLREHKELDKRLFWIEDASDEFLTKIYATSTCLIAASYGEGFGLPLIEAARHKLPIICRDIPVFREVAGQHAHYFIASNGGELAHSIQQWLNEYKIKKHPKSDHMPYLTWKQSADMLLNILK